MKIIHVNQARSVWLFDVSDLNPGGRDITEAIVEWIKERYSFVVVPDVKEVRSKAGTPNAIGLVFKQGRFQAADNSFIELSLAIHNDGIVVDTTSSTQEADRFAADFLSSAAKQFGLAYEPGMVRRRLYVSILIVKSEMDLGAIHPGLAAFADRMSSMLQRTTGGNSPTCFQVTGLSFWTEPSDSGVHKTFTLVPQAGKALSEHRYFSEAPFRTEDHFSLLEDLEKVITNK